MQNHDKAFLLAVEYRVGGWPSEHENRAVKRAFLLSSFRVRERSLPGREATRSRRRAELKPGEPEIAAITRREQKPSYRGDTSASRGASFIDFYSRFDFLLNAS